MPRIKISEGFVSINSPRKYKIEEKFCAVSYLETIKRNSSMVSYCEIVTWYSLECADGFKIQAQHKSQAQVQQILTQNSLHEG